MNRNFQSPYCFFVFFDDTHYLSFRTIRVRESSITLSTFSTACTLAVFALRLRFEPCCFFAISMSLMIELAFCSNLNRLTLFNPFDYIFNIFEFQNTWLYALFKPLSRTFLKLTNYLSSKDHDVDCIDDFLFVVLG